MNEDNPALRPQYLEYMYVCVFGLLQSICLLLNNPPMIWTLLIDW